MHFWFFKNCLIILACILGIIVYALWKGNCFYFVKVRFWLLELSKEVEERLIKDRELVWSRPFFIIGYSWLISWWVDDEISCGYLTMPLFTCWHFFLLSGLNFILLTMFCGVYWASHDLMLTIKAIHLDELSIF